LEVCAKPATYAARAAAPQPARACAGCHVEQRAVAGGEHHPRRGRGDGGVVVEHASTSVSSSSPSAKRPSTVSTGEPGA
jgi:hypothetical protein